MDTDFADFAAVQSGPLLGFAHALTADPHDAWDLTQETLARMGERWGRSRFDEPAAYARTVMVRLNIDRIRRLRRELPLLGGGSDDAPVGVVGDELDGWLLEALATLSTRQRAALALRYVEDLDVRGIAERMGDPPGRIWMSSPIDVTGSEADDDARVVEPFVYFEGIVAKLSEDRTFRLPVWGPGDSSSYPITLFVADSEDQNEVASSTDSSGTVRVLRASCDPTPVLELEVDATLGSEVGKGSLDLAGSLR